MNALSEKICAVGKQLDVKLKITLKLKKWKTRWKEILRAADLPKPPRAAFLT